MKKVSIVMPVYNAEKSLVKCVESILSSKYEDFEKGNAKNKKQAPKKKK